ncbi:MAG TPA: nucleoside triphosphate pyrophosphohydrolase [Candidatus Nanoarchaeia archaeon]|nr:nucleoside triphosphate pyrophosphohydrolase [Candidatus Nanoarchaeia archaeon]
MPYPKLVRDRIPEIIQSKGSIPIFRIASEEEYHQKLKEKLQEEVEEFLKDESEEELADILEVIKALAKLKKVDDKDLELLRKKKAEERGGFEKRIVLEGIE